MNIRDDDQNDGANDQDDVAHKKSTAKRKLIKTLALGGVFTAGQALPNKWASPVVNAVVIPSHASTTGSGGDPGGGAPGCEIVSCTSGSYIVGTTSMSLALCVEIMIPGAIDDINEEPNCIVRVGGQVLPTGTASGDSPSSNVFLCCWFYDGPRFAGDISVEVRIDDGSVCVADNVGTIPDRETGLTEFCLNI